MKDFNGKVAVITGAGSPRGIGRATASLLLSRGAKVVVADVNADALEQTVIDLKADGEVLGVPTDVSDAASVQALADASFSAFGRVDVAFLNAGIGLGGTFLGDDLPAWERMIGVNQLSVLYGIKAFLPRMVAQGGHGHLLATSSGAGVIGTNYGGPTYAMTKAAVVSLMESLHGTLRDKGIDITTTVVLPPLTASNLGGNPDIMSYVEKNLRAGGVPAKVAQPEMIAQIVLEAIENDSFWANPTAEQDERIFGGILRETLAWENGLLEARRAALAERTAPDPYLWGGPVA